MNKNIMEKLIEIVGPERVTDDVGELYCYSMDVSPVRKMPDYVVMLRSTEEVSKIVKLANEHEIPIIARGAATGMAGGIVPVKGGIVLDLSGMNKILEIDIDNLQVLVEPGVIHGDLNRALERYGFFFPPDPASSDFCTIGGLIGNDGSGMRAVKYGTTKQYVLDLEVVMADGEVINTGSKTLKTVSGYDLNRLFVGSEGTLGVITMARLKILPLPAVRKKVVAYFDELETAGKVVVRTLSDGIIPAACEIIDRAGIVAVNKYDPNAGLPDVSAILLFELDGNASAVEEDATRLAEICKEVGAVDVRVPTSKEEEDMLWSGRKNVGAAVSRIDPALTRVYLADDIGVPIKNVPEMLREISRISKEYDLPIITYGHIGDGNLHTGMAIDVLDEEQWKKAEKVAAAIYESALKLEGTATGEHGVGIMKGEWMKKEHPSSFNVMLAIKKALDPKNIMNPGKMGM